MYDKIDLTSQQHQKSWQSSSLRETMLTCVSDSAILSSLNRSKAIPSRQNKSKLLEQWLCFFEMHSYQILCKHWKEIQHSSMEVLLPTSPMEIHPLLQIESHYHVPTMLSQKRDLAVTWELKNSCISKPTLLEKPLIV